METKPVFKGIFARAAKEKEVFLQYEKELLEWAAFDWRADCCSVIC